MADATRTAVGVRVQELWNPPRDRRRWSRAQGLAMARAFRRSGASIAEFARQHGLGEWRVRRWAGRDEEPIAAGGPTPSRDPVVFAPVRLVAPAPPASTGGERGDGALEVVIDGVVVRVGRGFDPRVLGQVVAVLRGARC